MRPHWRGRDSSATTPRMANVKDGETAWRRFLCVTVGVAVAGALLLFAFVAVVDPWGGLPLAPSLPRHTVSSQSRFTKPMLARDARFDSAVVGTSIAKLLRPDALNAALGGRFVNLAFEAATAYEQQRMLEVFLRAHPDARTIVLSLDVRWCDGGPELRSLPGYPFPEWLYAPQRWAGYREALTLTALRDAWAQAVTMAGLRRPRRGDADGYVPFDGAEAAWNLPRALERIASFGIMPAPREQHGEPGPYVTHDRLEKMLEALPATTLAVLFFPPYALAYQGPPEGAAARYWAGCKDRVAALVRARRHTALVDFLRDTPFTHDPAHYYDGMHYRLTVADRLAADIAQAANGVVTEEDYVLLVAAD